MVIIDGQRLRQLRRQRGLSQETLADRAGVSVATVGRLERCGRPSCRGRTLGRLAAVLGEHPAAIIPTDHQAQGVIQQPLMNHQPRSIGRVSGPALPAVHGTATAPYPLARDTGPGNRGDHFRGDTVAPGRMDFTDTELTRAMWDQIRDLHVRYGDVPVEIRLLKVTEEAGEAAEAFIGMHGLNLRKGVCRSRDDLLAELADVIITAAVAMTGVTEGDIDEARSHLEQRLAVVTERARR
jgi:Helix-turn-helix domain